MQNQKKTKTKIRNKLSLNSLLYNEKFVMCFSVLVSFILWIVISSTSADPDVKTVTDITISVPELSNELQVFSMDKDKAEIRVKGNKLVLGTLQSSDILVTPSDISAVSEPGQYKLNLTAKKQGMTSDYEFDSTVTPSTVTVFVDRRAEKYFDIEENVTVSQSNSEYYYQTPVLSAQKIKISGAESVVNRVASVRASYNVNSALTKTSVFTVPISFYDTNGEQIISDMISAEFENVNVTVPVLKTKRVPIKAQFTNVPDLLEIDDDWLTLSQSTIQIAAADDVIDSISQIQTAPIDFTKISSSTAKLPGVELEIPTSCRNLDNIDKVDVSFNMVGYTQKVVQVRSIEVKGENSGTSATVVDKSLNVTIVGPSDQISALKSSDISASVNLDGREDFVGYVELPINVSIAKYNKCWVYSEYTATVSVKKVP